MPSRSIPIPPDGRSRCASAAGSDQAVALSTGDSGCSEFVLGNENALLLAAFDAATATNPVYNPISIVGPSGFGKTTFAWSVLQQRNLSGCGTHLFFHGSEFARAYGHAVERNSVDDFRQRLLAGDALVVDDVHQLAEKLQAQRELLRVLDHFSAATKLVLVTSLKTLAIHSTGFLPGLTSRLAAGLCVAIQPLSPATCRAIVVRLASDLKLALTDPAVDFVAACCRSKDVAEPPGFQCAVDLQQFLMSFADPLATSQPIGKADVEARYSRLSAIYHQRLTKHTVSSVAKLFSVRPVDLLGATRRRQFVRARSVAMFLLRRLTGWSYGRIGKLFGGRDHSTVMHACRKIAADSLEDFDLKNDLDELRYSIERLLTVERVSL